MAGPFPQSFIDSVRDAGDIARLVSDYVPLKQAGARLKGLCPFHQEKTPSFSVDPNNQLFYCFGCQTGGDIFKFVMLYDNVPFKEAVEQLAQRWGVPLPAVERRPGDEARERLQRLTETAAAYFGARLADPQTGRRCREYLTGRRLDEATASRLGVGYAPDSWEALRGQLVEKRFKDAEIQRAGLIVPRKSGSGHYDRFRDRLIFPIRDIHGHVIAFGGRTLGDAEPKYINSPETPLYKKGLHLYGLDLARDAIRREGFAVVVEGYLDLAAVAQAGFHNVVASLGTAFTAEQARLLARYTTRVVFSYDGDSAGAAATARSLDLLLGAGFEVRIVELPGGSDPDDFIGRHGAEAYGTLLRQAPDYLEFLIRRESKTRDLGRVEEKVDAVNAVLPHIAKLGNAIQRGAWATRLADALQIDDELVLQELRVAVKTARPQIRRRPATARPVREAEARLVNCLMSSEQERDRWCSELDLEDLKGTQVVSIVRVILDLARSGRRVDHPSVLEALSDDADRELLSRIAFRDEPEEGPNVDDCLWSFKKQSLAREERRVVREIGSHSGSAADVDRQLQRLQELARQRDTL